MLIEESIRRQNELRKCLYEMATTCMDETEIRSMAIKLKALYTDGFRHNYSDFFPLIVEIAKDDNIYSLDYLSENIEAARAMVEKDYIGGEKEFRGLYRPLSKLSDHINLEIGRYSYYSINEQRVKDLEKRNQMLQTDLRMATDELESSKNSIFDADRADSRSKHFCGNCSCLFGKYKFSGQYTEWHKRGLPFQNGILCVAVWANYLQLNLPDDVYCWEDYGSEYIRPM